MITTITNNNYNIHNIAVAQEDNRDIMWWIR